MIYFLDDFGDGLLFCRLGRYAVESYLEQILSHGFFHADPVSSFYFYFQVACFNMVFFMMVTIFGDCGGKLDELLGKWFERELKKLK